MKKFLRPLLMLTLLVAACILLNPTKAQAASADDLTFVLNNDGKSYCVTDCKESATGALTVPAAHQGKPVTAIGSSAFYGCTGLTGIAIPDSVTTIGDGALGGCSNLESLTIPFVGRSRKTAKDTYQYPFGYIFGSRSYAGGVATYQYFHGSGTSDSTFANYYIPASLKSVTVTGGEILYGAFSNCSGLADITLPDSAVAIGRSAFSGCTGLTGITIADGVTTIGAAAFAGCAALADISLPDSVTTIANAAFDHCSALTGLAIPDSVTTIGYNAFQFCTGLVSLTIPDSVTAIGDGALWGCSSLESLTIPFVGGSRKTANDTYQYPFGYIFGHIEYTGGVVIYQSYYGSNLRFVTNSPYYIPTSLKSVTVTGGEILYGAFSNCSGLTGVTIPGSVTTIADYAFAGCDQLRDIQYAGTCKQWAAIQIGEDNEPLNSAKKHTANSSHIYTDDADRICDVCGAVSAYPGGSTLVYENGRWRHIVNRQKVYDTTLVKFAGDWYYVKNGVVDFSATTLCYYGGYWFYVKNGQVDWTSNTLCYWNGKWYHINGGKVVYDTTLVYWNGKWWYVKSGVVNQSNTLCYWNGKWYHVNGGTVVYDTTLVYWNGKWWYVKSGVVNQSNTLCYWNGKWYHVNGGTVVYDTTLCYWNGKWWYVKSGVVNQSNTLCYWNGKWYHVRGGTVVYDTTLVYLGSNWYYVKNGVVDHSYSGKVLFAGTYYTVKNGVKI